MFDIRFDTQSDVLLYGRLDAVSAPVAREFLDELDRSCRLDFRELDYVASAGLGVLVLTQRRLSESGHALTLANMNPHLRDVFDLAGFASIFAMETCGV